MSGRVPIETRVVERPAERVPFRDWAPELKAQWEEFSAERINRELRFMHWLGLALCIVCLFFDAHAGVLDLGLLLRLGVVVPVYLVAIALLRGGDGPIRTLATIVPITVFAGVVSYLGVSTQSVFADRYVMASAMIVAFSLALVPLRIGPALVMAAAGFAAIAIPVVIIAGTGAAFIDLLEFALLCSIVPVPFKLRADRLRDSNFLLTLESRRAQEDLLTINRQLETLSTIDPLTGVLNRRGFERAFAAAFEAARQADDGFAVLLLDIDHFKRFNDTHGHQAGDRCLVEVGRLLKDECARHDGFAGRFGGEEFIAALVGEASRDAETVANDIRTQIGQMAVIDHKGSEPRVTDHRGIEDKGRAKPISVSIGVRIGSPRSTSRETFVTDADRALYAAKNAGRNRVVALGDEARDARGGETSSAGALPDLAGKRS